MTTFKMNFNGMDSFRQAWTTDLKEGRFFVPTEKAAPFLSKIELQFVVAGVARPFEVKGEVVFVRDESHCKSGESPGMGVSLLLDDVLRTRAQNFMEGRAQKAPTRVKKRWVPRQNKSASDSARVETLKEKIARESDAFEEQTRGGNHYAVLGVPLNTDEAEIRKKYSALMRRFHPDVYFRRLDDRMVLRLECIYQRVTVAYETLIDPESRREYDLEIRNFKTGDTSSKENLRVLRRRKFFKSNPKMVNLSESLYGDALDDVRNGDNGKAKTKLKLALKYNPYLDKASELLTEIAAKEA